MPDQCELHSELLGTIANRKQNVKLTKQMLLTDIDITMPTYSPPLKINHLAKKRNNIQVSESEITWKTHTLFVVPTLVITGIGVGIVIYMYRTVNSHRIMKHISAPP